MFNLVASLVIMQVFHRFLKVNSCITDVSAILLVDAAVLCETTHHVMVDNCAFGVITTRKYVLLFDLLVMPQLLFFCAPVFKDLNSKLDVANGGVDLVAAELGPKTASVMVAS